MICLVYVKFIFGAAVDVKLSKEGFLYSDTQEIAKITH